MSPTSRSYSPIANILEPELLELSHFLTNAPSILRRADNNDALSHLLPDGEGISCVLWNGLYHISGCDIVKAISFRFRAIGRPVVSMKRLETGIVSDLRQLRNGADACLEPAKVNGVPIRRKASNWGS